jgi:hypothetical protein
MLSDYDEPKYTTRDRYVWLLEMGERVALETQYLQRDMRWWWNLWGPVLWLRKHRDVG